MIYVSREIFNHAISIVGLIKLNKLQERLLQVSFQLVGAEFPQPVSRGCNLHIYVSGLGNCK
jgi:hypothetical protein